MADAQLNLEYRKEVLSRFFELIHSGESFYVIGAPSVGKTRLMDFLLGDNVDAASKDPFDRHAVKNHYLGEVQASATWLVRVDLNRLSQEHDWSFHFYELLLSSVLFACSKHPETGSVKEIETMLADLDSRVIQSKDTLMAHRLFEMAMNTICQSYRLKLCFLFDEFDEPYKKMPREIFAQLRAVRDANKYRLFYVLFLRNLPETLRKPTENESFYELISRNLVGIGPYTRLDALQIIQHLERRKNFSLTQEKREWLFLMSGGHPGLLIALFGTLSQQTLPISEPSWYFKQESVAEEFRKIWNGLTEEEKDGLLAFSRGDLAHILPAARKILTAKGLLRPDGRDLTPFSPLLPLFLAAQTTQTPPPKKVLS